MTNQNFNMSLGNALLTSSAVIGHQLTESTYSSPLGFTALSIRTL